MRVVERFLAGDQGRFQLRYLPWMVPALALIVALPYHFWLIDDAYITFRTVQNVATGYGLTWNTTERVQAYTHPLWMLLVTLLYLPLRSLPAAAWTLSAGCTVAALAIAWRNAGGPWTSRAAALALLLLGSKCFMDYTSSGLENPLTYLLVVIYYAPQVLRVPAGEGNDEAKDDVSWRLLVASLAFTNRQDTLLFFAPDLAWRGVRLLRARQFRFMGRWAAALSPVFAWELFAVFYYGFPFPNTYYAKLGATGIALVQQLRHGYWYFEHTASADPLTSPILALGLAAALWVPRLRTPALGLLAYLSYVLAAGAASTHMCGRFLAAPYLLGALIAVEAVRPTRYLVPIALAVIVLAPRSPARVVLGGYVPIGTRGHAPHGIGDVRYFASVEGLALFAEKPFNVREHGWVRDGIRASQDVNHVHVGGPGGGAPIGLFGFGVGPEEIVVDRLGLSDPLLARLPRDPKAEWSPGHVPRRVPNGYAESLRTGENLIEDESLHEYYEHLRLVTQGPLWSSQRFATIVGFNLGLYDHLVDEYVERHQQK